ncbi:MAG: hypothetical protein D6732_23800, partial [Methanobacteriota archaeon]
MKGLITQSELCQLLNASVKDIKKYLVLKIIPEPLVGKYWTVCQLKKFPDQLPDGALGESQRLQIQREVLDFQNYLDQLHILVRQKDLANLL